MQKKDFLVQGLLQTCKMGACRGNHNRLREEGNCDAPDSRKLRGAGGFGRNRRFLCFGKGKEAVGVERNAVLTNFEMQMRPRGAAGLAKLAHALALQHNVADLDNHF